MPPLDNLPEVPPEQLRQHQSVAERMHLIHVTHGRPGLPTLADLIARQEIPTSEERNDYCGPGTRFVEGHVGFPPSVYFYAGRACPDYGQVALAFPPTCETDRVHSATPFGTGGVVKQDIGRAFRLNVEPDDLGQRIRYCRSSTVAAEKAPGWRSLFARWLLVYYPTGAAGYWTKPPEHHDPEGLYALNSDNWQAWTWEVRFHRGPHVLEADRWTVDPNHLNELRQQLRDRELAPEDVGQLVHFLNRLENPSGTVTFCEDLKRWVRARCL
jgi:hypothetical protein